MAEANVGHEQQQGAMPLTHFGVAPHASAPASTLPSIPRFSQESAASALSSPDLNYDIDRLPPDEAVVVTPALVRITVCAGLGSLLFGFDTGVVSGALVVIGTDLGGARLSPGQEEWIVSSALVGALVGSLAAGRLADWWGRKPVLLTAAALLLLGCKGFPSVSSERRATGR